MTPEQEKFLEHYKEERNYFRDPEIIFNGIISIEPKRIKLIDLIGNFLLLISVPLIITFATSKITFDFLIIIFFLGISFLWITINLTSRIKRITVNNRVEIDSNSETISITPIDYFRKEILNKKSIVHSFNSFNEILLKQERFDKYNPGIHLLLKNNFKKTKLIDIGTIKLGEKLAELLSELTKKDLNRK
jgi:hypothetical protein